MADGFAATTWNPADNGSACTLSGGNLTAVGRATNGTARSAIGVSTGKWYWEASIYSGARPPIIGVGQASAVLTGYPGTDALGWGYHGATGNKIHTGAAVAFAAAWSNTAHVLGIALDADAGSIEIFLNNTSLGVMYTGMTGPFYAMTGGDTDGAESGTVANFGASAFAFTPPSGYMAGLGVVIPELHADAAAVAPSATLSMHAGGLSNLTAPSATLSAYAAAVSALVGPSPTAVISASIQYRSAQLTAPSPTFVAFGGAAAAATAPSPQVLAAGTGTVVGRATLTAPSPTVGGSGSAATMANGELSISIASVIGYSGAVCSVTLSDGPTIQATGVAGSVGSAQFTAPLFELTATATVHATGSAVLIAPSPVLHSGGNVAYLVAPGATLTAIGHAVVTATYEAYAVNLKHQPKPGKEPNDEVTRYTNFPFTHIVRYKNSYFGANSTGLYLLDGTTDYATPTPTAIPWAFKTAMTDFKSQQHKTVASAYFGGRLGAAATVQLHVGEDGPQTYSYATVRTDHAQNYRQVFGKGTKARYFALGASGTGTLELDDIALDVHALTRRI